MPDIFSNPAAQYIISFGALGLILNLAIHYLDTKFELSERVCGLLTLGLGAGGGILFQLAGLITLPGAPLVVLTMAAFIGAAVAAAAAGFSNVDLRQIGK